MYIAHSPPEGKKSLPPQPLSVHLQNVGKKCADLSSSFDAEIEGQIIGDNHDYGKASDEGQKRICDNGPRVDHSTAGSPNIPSLWRSTPVCPPDEYRSTAPPRNGGLDDPRPD